MAIQYAEPEGASIAYEVLSDSGPDVILLPPIGSRAVARSIPTLDRYYDGIARFSRLTVYDRRGSGMSDVTPEPPTLEQHVSDLEAVRIASGAERITLASTHVGTMIMLAYALTHRDKVERLIIVNGTCCDAADPAGPVGRPPFLPWESMKKLNASRFDSFFRAYLAEALPSLDASQREETLSYYKASVTPRTFHPLMSFARDVDLRDRLAEISAASLVVHTNKDRFGSIVHGRYLAQNLPQAELVELPTDVFFPWMDPDTLGTILQVYEEFLTGRVRHSAGRTLATVLFTDIVGSTERQRALGDGAWRWLREEFERETRRHVDQFGGRTLHFTGDGAVAAFPLPSEALRSARRLVEAAQRQGIEIRAGLHSGEVDTLGDDLSGICVNIAARVAASASAGEVLATTTVRDLVEGTSLRFSDAGDAELKGVGKRALVRLAND